MEERENWQVAFVPELPEEVADAFLPDRPKRALHHRRHFSLFSSLLSLLSLSSLSLLSPLVREVEHSTGFKSITAQL